MSSQVKQALDKITSYEELYQFIDQATSEVSFLGRRYIKVGNYKDVLSIHALSLKAMQIIEKNFEFNESERRLGKLIARKIDKIYAESDKKAERNIITYLLSCLREFWQIGLKPVGLQPRWCWEEDFSGRCAFDFYTKAQYLQVFHLAPIPGTNNISSSRTPKRWCAPSPSELKRAELKQKKLTKPDYNWVLKGYPQAALPK